jgi:hypothetical protein
VTGRRELPPGAIASLEAQIDACLAATRDELAKIAASPAAQAVYRAPDAGEVPFTLRIVSPLAEGADRLVAAAGERIGAELYFPLPFPQAVYETDFLPESVETFRKLLDKGQKFELDGFGDDPMLRDESYEAVGRFVVGASDFLIAIWDGKRPQGRGGTGEIAPYSVSAGTPVWWIDERGGLPPKFLRDTADFNAPERAPTGDAAFAALRTWIAQSASPPAAGKPERDGPLGLLAEHLCRRWNWDAPPIADFFNEGPLPRRWVWRAYAAMVTLIAPQKPGEAAHLLPAIGPAEVYWHGLLEAPDRFANGYGDRYRSSYVWIALLALTALSAAALFGETERAVRIGLGVFEFVVGGLMLGLVLANQTRRWHERWISYRLLAELCRKQYALAPIGRALPGSDVSQLASEAEDALPPRDVWVAWYFLAALRAAPFPVGSMEHAKQRALEVGRSLIREQRDYHRNRKDQAARAGKQIQRASEAFFAFTILLAVAKVLAVASGMDKVVHAMILVGAFLSSGAGALVGIRTYSEFNQLAHQSAHMLLTLAVAERNLEAAATLCDKPLSSRQIGQTLSATTTEMMRDITGWAQLFRLKPIEAG